ncbi:SMI1/KNR4 family protein [Burkholderia sp. Ac-20353]|uniref:SMI1/KNR4 family protein n=1 Tax=Burkholderia sp. Ac-20353 TaxID=2703894 RepID=UPI00197B4166|nr:SMI1/KNR4 family protein [Burkholderia sp. Ac-20353]MBN3788029.1 SMI1/KNR4 family protein [Burkholderia sp. Ac-20353]
MQATDFSDDEIAQLRANGIVLFANRVIFDAQPPMPADQVAAVQASCNGTLPPALVELWQLTAGGSLDYDLTLPMNGNQEAISWTELFYNGSKGYRDLEGWIAHELELAEEAADERGEPWSGKLDVLPFGGFEYCDRVYIVTAPEADDCGQVLAWKQGLPPAWRGRLHEDGLATIATDLHAAFRALQLDADPQEPDGQSGTGEALLDYVEACKDRDSISEPLADKLIAFYRRALIDWRTPLANGTLATQPALARKALRYAIDHDDTALVTQLASTGVNLDKPLVGSLIPTEYGLRRKAYDATAALVELGGPVAADSLESVSGAIPPALIELLLDAGAQPNSDVMASCVAYGASDSARLIGAALAEHGVDVASAYASASGALLQKLVADAAKVRTGKHHHYLGLESLEAHAQRIREFVL